MPKQNCPVNKTAGGNNAVAVAGVATTGANCPAFVAGALIGNGANVCRQFARILGGDITDQTADSCTVMRMRTELAPTILRRPAATALTLAALFSYESPDTEGRTLNLGETVILQREVNPFIDVLRENKILVTALHNHWMFDRPRLMYIHFESISDPLVFAQAIADAWVVLTGRSEEDTE